MKKQPYTKMVNFTVTDEQHGQLQQEAERLGVSVSELIRAMLFRKRRPRGVSLGGFERQEPKALL
jgi:antitoxin component of RelBE/YafQ-DinJ toxin-antitoxin module